MSAYAQISSFGPHLDEYTPLVEAGLIIDCPKASHYVFRQRATREVFASHGASRRGRCPRPDPFFASRANGRRRERDSRAADRPEFSPRCASRRSEERLEW